MVEQPTISPNSPPTHNSTTAPAIHQNPNTWYIFPPKLVYGESPKILFVPPRSFISMVQLRILRRTRSRSLARAFASSPTPPTTPFGDVNTVVVTSYGINQTAYSEGLEETKEGRIPAKLEKVRR